MNLAIATRYLSVIGIIGVALTIIQFVGRITLNEAGWLDAVNVIAWICLLIGFVGVYFNQVEELGAPGFIGLVTMVAATAWVIGDVYFHSYAYPVIQHLDASAISNDMAESDLPSPYRESAIASSYAYLVGPFLYGLAIAWKSKSTRWPGVLLIVVGLGSVLDSQVEILGLVSYLGTPVALFWMCVKQLKLSKKSVTPREIE